MIPNNFLKDSQNANNIILYFIIDENKDRQTKDYWRQANETNADENEDEFVQRDVTKEESIVYLDTIGKSRNLDNN